MIGWFVVSEAKKAFDVAHGMEVANRQASELHASTKEKETGNGPVHKVSPQTTTRTKASPRCGWKGHSPDSCYSKPLKCHTCGKKGHLARMCKSAQDPGLPRDQRPRQPKGRYKRHQNQQMKYVTEESEQGSEEFEQDSEEGEMDSEYGLFQIRCVQGSSTAAIVVNPHINGVSLSMELDTGAAVSLVSKKTWERHFPGVKLTKSETLLKTYSGEKLKVEGQADVHVSYQEQEKTLPLIVVSGQGPFLWGRNWLAAIRLNWTQIKQVQKGLESVLKSHEEVFQNELGTLKDVTAQLQGKEDAVPKFHKPRPVPYALRGAIEKELEQLENLGIIEKTTANGLHLWCLYLRMTAQSDCVVTSKSPSTLFLKWINTLCLALKICLRVWQAVKIGLITCLSTSTARAEVSEIQHPQRLLSVSSVAFRGSLGTCCFSTNNGEGAARDTSCCCLHR